MWLPTLDLQIRVEVTNKISYLYYEKPTTTNVMVQKKTALDENSKHQILSNDLIRRLGNTDENQGAEVMAKVIDNFGVKVLTSGYNITQARKITINGIRGWEKKRNLARQRGERIFRTAEESISGRVKKRTIGKTSWFRKRGKNMSRQREQDC